MLRQCETVHRFGGSDCSTAVNWARKDGIYANPDWFPELQAGASSWEEFQMHIHSASPDQCPKPCTLTYDSYSAPTFRSAGMPVMKGIAYGPAPLKSDKKVLLNDDFTDEIAGAMWAPWGRNDLQVIKDMGANTIRLYGNDPNVSKRDFLDEAMKDGFSVISGMSDYGFIQGPTPCEKDNWYCFDQVYESYMVNLKHGLTINNFTSYHPALKALIISNEPDLKVKPRSLTCRAMVSSWDAILQAEKDLGVTGNPIAFTVTFTFASWGAGAPGLSQMQDFYHCLKNPGAAPTLYTPKNDVLKAYNERFVNSFNTNNPAADVKRLLIDKYARSFWNSALKIPLFIGEYHSTYKAVRQDLKDMMAVASDQRYPFFMGLNFFEFSVRYDKGGSEMNFGAFGYGNCLLSNMNFSGDVYSIWNLVPTKDKVRVSRFRVHTSSCLHIYRFMD
ncbi:unnamed protein product [Polarella glacialis]|uniref:Uncharacterized protein n=1 Tax=Polarella glacialis TaxID=89957 RepID=A0A813JWC3_POLGL|nr:unnamed protein product [Polarella glacialis]